MTQLLSIPGLVSLSQSLFSLASFPCSTLASPSSLISKIDQFEKGGVKENRERTKNTWISLLLRWLLRRDCVRLFTQNFYRPTEFLSLSKGLSLRDSLLNMVSIPVSRGVLILPSMRRVPTFGYFSSVPFVCMLDWSRDWLIWRDD